MDSMDNAALQRELRRLRASIPELHNVLMALYPKEVYEPLLAQACA